MVERSSMVLPDGVKYSAGQRRLIAKDESALIRIEISGRYVANRGYAVRYRSFDDDIAPFLQGPWRDFHEAHCIAPGMTGDTGSVYCGAEHAGPVKLPNITVVPNLSTEQPGNAAGDLRVLGCTMGHYHVPMDPQDPKRGEPGRWVQEVYEFLSYGLLVLDHGQGEVEFWVARAGDKVTVPNGCHMTLYNLGDERQPLVTLDFANPERNPANKNLVGELGPILLGYYDNEQSRSKSTRAT